MKQRFFPGQLVRWSKDFIFRVEFYSPFKDCYYCVLMSPLVNRVNTNPDVVKRAYFPNDLKPLF